ncbi:hypothetical protein [Simkania sp.]|uniref:hypothetical protein n=1 Tax=Simkania sp. TaxID=34094 RepID=UPI003B52E2E2
MRGSNLEVDYLLECAKTFSYFKTHMLFLVVDLLLEAGKIENVEQILADLENELESLSVKDRLKYMKFQAHINPETLFTSFERYQSTLWEKEDDDHYCQVLMVLAQARLDRDEIEQAKELATEIERLQKRSAHLEPPKDNFDKLTYCLFE